MSKQIIMFFLVLFSCNVLYPVTKGSETAVSVEPLYTFSGSTNDMLGFGWFKEGFKFQDSSTSCTFNNVFPVSGEVDLNGGTLYLAQDLLFHNVTNLQGMGTVIGTHHLLDMCSSITSMPSDAQKFSDVNLTFNNDITFNSSIAFEGDCVITGNGNRIFLGSSGNITVAADSTLKIKNVRLENVAGTNISCADNDSHLILDDVKWIQDAAVTFSNGSITIINAVDFMGSSTFSYESPCTSLISANSRWTIAEHLCLSIGKTSSVEPLQMADLTSALNFSDSSWFVRSPGMMVSKGTVEIHRDVVVDVDSTSTSEGLIFGDGVTSSQLCFEMFPGCSIRFTRGHVLYDVVGDSNWIVSKSVTSHFIRESESVFYINQDIDLPAMTVTNDYSSVFEVALGKVFNYKDVIFHQPQGEYQLNANRYNWYTYLLDGDKYIFMQRGDFIMYILAAGTGNKLQGTGTISGGINLANSASELITDFNGVIDYDITLNGGRLTLAQDLSLMNGAKLANNGTIDLSTYSMILGYNDIIDWSGSYTWQGIGGCVVLNSNLNMQGSWIFSGTCIIDGGNNTLDISDGEIILAEDTTLCLKNIKITGIAESNIRCLNDAGSIIMDDASFYLSDGFTYTLGSFRVIDNVTFSGGSCAYHSNKVSSIAPYSSLTMIGMRFEIGKEGANSTGNPFTFEDKTSSMVMDNTQIVIYSDGLNMTKGVVLCRRDVTMEINSTSTDNGLFLGDGTPAGDMTVEIDAGGSIEITKGHITYNVTSGEGFRGRSKYAKMKRNAGTMFYAKKSVMFRDLMVDDNPEAFAAADPGVMMLYDNVTFLCNDGEYQSEYIANAYSYGMVDLLLAGNQTIWLSKRSLPIKTYIMGTGNRIFGDGGILQPITFLSSDAQLNLGIDGFMSGGINLNGGTVNLEAPLKGVMPCGPGIINLSNYSLEFCYNCLSWNDPILWQSDNANLILNANITLSSTWTFTGDCTIYGNNNMLDLSEGSLVIEENSHVVLKNICLYGISEGTICCMGDNSSLTLNEVTWAQDDDYTFSTGSFTIKDVVKMKGDATFIYKSDQISTISEDAILKLEDNFVFSYAPTVTAQNLLVFADETATLQLSGGTLHACATGLALTKGRLFVKEHSYLSSDVIGMVNEGIIFGDGTSENDFLCELSSGVNLNVMAGSLRYKNVNSSSFTMYNAVSKLWMNDDTTLWLHQDLPIDPGIVVFGSNTMLRRNSGAKIVGSISLRGQLNYGSLQ